MIHISDDSKSLARNVTSENSLTDDESGIASLGVQIKQKWWKLDWMFDVCDDVISVNNVY